ncbi:MAG: hypothetical protein ABIS50_19495 [Luteolibacter sp.]|uniref:hypothetical protein n=1 Tax=Luteolibacter sp. TaxID=1962973 RepID=UPI003263C50B
MSDEIPRYSYEESRGLESVPMEPQPVLSAEAELIGGEAHPDQPLSGPDGDTSQLPPATEVATRSPKAMIVGLGVAAAVLAAFSGYELLQAKESDRLLDEAYGKAATVEISRKNLESDLREALSKKDLEIEEARADSQRLAENLAKEQEKNRILQAHADKAAAAVQAKVGPGGELDSLKSTYRELAKDMAKVEAEVRRLSGEVASRKTSSSVSKPKQKTPSAVERTVLQISSGPNKGRWHFVAADGFRSPLYGSREGALRDAELHGRTGY